MAIHALQKGQIARKSPQTAQTIRIPAPERGVDVRTSLSADATENCIYTFNLVPYEYGLTVRKGYREWQTAVETEKDAGFGVHTLIPFDGIEEQGVDDRLFAVTNEGIWDVTQANSTPTLELVFTNQTPNAGYGVYTHYVGDDEKDILYYADNFNGMFDYDPATGIWAQASNITGPDIPNIRYLLLHKQRLWMVEENSTKAWYLDVGAKIGAPVAATPFYFGSKFKHGGNLEGLFNWTVDGGDGIDDYLIAVSRAGDVLVYKGTDPDGAATWELVGTYFIGSVPRGPNFGTEQGGNLFLLSAYGVTSVRDLMEGASAISSPDRSVAGKISGLLRRRMESTLSEHGWSIASVPSEGALVISTPIVPNRAPIQYFYNFAVDSWGLFRDVPMACFDTWLGSIVVGTPDNRILYMDATADEVPKDAEEGVLNGNSIKFSILTSFTTLGAPSLFKRVNMVRPDFVSINQPAFDTIVRYDFDLEEGKTPVALPSLTGDLWDLGIWDTATWGSDLLRGFNKPAGGWGTGRYVAIAMRGSSRDRTRLAGWDVIFDTGGPLL